MALSSSLFLLLSLSFLASVKSSDDVTRHHHPHHSSTEFDFFVFAQTWPETNCIEWKDRSSRNRCSLPHSTRWTVHGLWPTKTGTHGPFNCNPRMKFDENKIKDILPELESHWTNVHANSGEFSFWEHEWTKHGTCAAQLPILGDEHKYFAMGLTLNDRFPLGDYLSKAGIVPGDDDNARYSFESILDAVTAGLGGKEPLVQCASDHKGHYISQIEVCLDKSLNVMDCNGSPNHGCPTHGDAILYPLPETKGKSSREQEEEILGVIKKEMNWENLLLVLFLFFLLTSCCLFGLKICAAVAIRIRCRDGKCNKANRDYGKLVEEA